MAGSVQLALPTGQFVTGAICGRTYSPIRRTTEQALLPDEVQAVAAVVFDLHLTLDPLQLLVGDAAMGGFPKKRAVFR